MGTEDQTHPKVSTGGSPPGFPADVVHYSVRATIKPRVGRSKGRIFVMRVKPPESPPKVREGVLLDLASGDACGPAFAVSDALGDAPPGVPLYGRPVPTAANHSARVRGQYLLREPFTRHEEYVVTVGMGSFQFDGIAPGICGAPVTVRVFDVDMMMACYQDGYDAIVERWRAAGHQTRSMHMLWATMIRMGLRALAPEYWKTAATCEGRIKQVGVCAAMSAVLAEEFWEVVVMNRGPQEYRDLVAKGDQDLPKSNDITDFLQADLLGKARKLVMLERFFDLSTQFGRVHMSPGIARALLAARRWGRIDQDCLASDLQLIAELLVGAQANTFVDFWPELASFGLGLVQDVFKRELRRNLVRGVRMAGLEHAASRLEGTWDLLPEVPVIFPGRQQTK